MERSVRVRRSVVAIAAALGVVCASCSHHEAAPTGFRDDFGGASLGAEWYPNRWFAASCSPGANPTEQQWYRPSQVAVSGGEMVLTARAGRSRCDEGSWAGTRDYVSGWAQTGGERSAARVRAPGRTFRYGRIDVRFRAPAGRGLWPAVWLLSPGTRDGRGKLPYPSRPEIDVVEIHGDSPATWRLHLHATTPAGDVDPSRSIAGPDTSAGFHTASVDWRADHITWFVDGVKRWTYRGPGIPHQPMYLVVNLAVGGDAGAPDPAAFPARMLIDRVSVTP